LPKGTTKEQLSELLLNNIRYLKGVTVYVDGSRFVLSDLYDYADEWMQLNAKDIILSFYGGPPPTRWWKNSTLLTMLLDYIIYAEKRGNKKAIRTALAIVQ
jgi:hypothetical protein